MSNLLYIEDIDFLAASHHWFADGTFRVTPDGFDQLYTIHAYVDGQSYPCVFALLPGRTETVYRRLLDHVVALGSNAAPQTVVTDFELASINALQSQFPSM